MFNAQTLVLDANWQPIDIFDWTNAIRKIMKKKAEMLEHYTDVEIGREWKSAMKCPSVVRLLHFIQKDNGHKKYQKLTRRNVLIRDNYECQYGCGTHLTTKNLSWDHVVPRHLGGKTTWTNIVSCCQKCNLKKGNKTLEESGMKLIRKPFAPLLNVNDCKYNLFNKLKKLPSEKWKNYIYFNIPLDE